MPLFPRPTRRCSLRSSPHDPSERTRVRLGIIARRQRRGVRPLVGLLEDRTLLSPFYDLSTLASTASGTFTGFGDLVSVDGYGDVAFVGDTSTGVFGGNGLYVEKVGSSAPVNINPSFSGQSNLSYGLSAAINDDGFVTAREQVASSPAQFLIRQWNANQPDANVVLSQVPAITQGSPDNQFSAFQTYTDINDDGDVAFVAVSADGAQRVGRVRQPQ